MHVVPAKAGIHLWCGMVVMPSIDPRLRGDDSSGLWTQAGREFPDLRVMISQSLLSIFTNSSGMINTMVCGSSGIFISHYHPAQLANLLIPLDDAFLTMDVTYLRYPDDILIMCKTNRQLNRCKQRMMKVLSERQLSLSTKKRA